MEISIYVYACESKGEDKEDKGQGDFAFAFADRICRKEQCARTRNRHNGNIVKVFISRVERHCAEEENQKRIAAEKQHIRERDRPHHRRGFLSRKYAEEHENDVQQEYDGKSV